MLVGTLDEFCVFASSCIQLCQAAASPTAFLVNKHACLFFQVLFLSLLIKLCYYVRHFCLLLEHFKLCLFENMTTEVQN